MHYKNGRLAKLGDKVLVPNGNYTFVGVVTQLVAGSDTCNLYAVPLQNAQLANCKDCVNIEDIAAVADKLPKVSRTDGTDA